MRANLRTRVMLTLGLSLVVLLGTIATRAGVGAQEASPMTTAETQETMEAYFAALLGGGAYETSFADDLVVTMTGVPGEIRGPAAAKAAIDAIHHQQFDAKPEVTNLVIGEGTAALEAVFVGTHTGEFAGIAPTGKEVSVSYSVFYALADGKITALRIYALVEGLVQQLQAAPRMSAGAPRSGTLHLMKECSEYTGEAAAYCTITSSNFDAIPIGSRIVYAEAATASGGLDSDLVFNTPSGDTAYGHVVLDGPTQTGMMTLAGGPASWQISPPTSRSPHLRNPPTAWTDRTRIRSDQRGRAPLLGALRALKRSTAASPADVFPAPRGGKNVSLRDRRSRRHPARGIRRVRARCDGDARALRRTVHRPWRHGLRPLHDQYPPGVREVLKHPLNHLEEQVCHIARDGQRGHVGGSQLLVAPARLAANSRVLALGVFVVGIVTDRAADVGRRDRGGRTEQPDWLRPSREQVRRGARGDPAPSFLRHLFQQSVQTNGIRRDAPPVTVGAGQGLPRSVLAGRNARVAIPRHVGVEIDHVRDALRSAVGDTSDDHPPVAPADQNDTGQILVVEHVDDILDVGVQIDLRAREVDALAVPGEGRGLDIVAGAAQVRRDPPPAPAAGKRAVDKDKSRHRSRPGRSSRRRATEDARRG
jgi:predicted ester cyclase